MDTVILARLQFAITTIFHFFYVPMSIGLSIFIAVLETRYVRSGDEKLKRMVKFLGKLFLILFAMGVASGIVQEFQFGMNWSGYSRYVGDIFGAPLAIEALLAFFLESTFLGLWIFGWEKLSKRAHVICMWLVAFATTISSYWILSANSFMQNPVGFIVNEETGRAELTDFFALLTNPHVYFQLSHVIAAAVTTAAFFILGIAAYHLVRKRNVDTFLKVFQQGAIFAVIGTISVVLIGHFQGQFLVQDQPMKMAAAEAHWNTSDPPDLDLIAIPDTKNGRNRFELSATGFLSFMSYNRFGEQVEGINDLQAQMEEEFGPGNYIPPVALTFYSFRIMFGAGLLMIVISIVALLWSRKKRPPNSFSLFLRVLLPCIALPFLANSAGWIMAEVGRQPWIVYGLQTVYEGVSTAVSAPSVLFTLLGFTAIYTVLTGIAIYLIAVHNKKGLEAIPETTKEEEGEAIWT